MHNTAILSVLLDESTGSLLVGDEKGHLNQYKQTRDSFRLVKEYKNLGVGGVCSSALLGRFGVFGGTNYYLVAVDIISQRVCDGYIKSPYKETASLRVCHSSDSQVYLSLGGSPPYYSYGPDCLDVTQALKQHQADKIITALKLKNQRLELDLQREKTRSRSRTN